MAESVAPKTSAGSSTSEDGADIVGGTEVVDGKAARDLSSTDIFEIAAELSSECANIGNRYGQDTVAKIVPCVVRVLEELEFAVEKAELLTADLVEAQHDAKLAKEEQQREVTYRRRIESEYQTALSEWEDKHNKLKQTVESMSADADDESAGKGSFLASLGRSKSIDRGADKAELTEALAQVETLRQEVRAKSLEEAKQASEVEALVQQVKRLAGVNQALRRSHQTAKLHSQTIVEEKTALAHRCKELQSRLQVLEEKPKQPDEQEPSEDPEASQGMETETTESDGTAVTSDRAKELRYSRMDMEKVLQERLEYKLRVDELEEEISDLKESMGLEVDENSFTVASNPATLRKRRNSRLRNLFQQLDADAENQGEGGPAVIPF